MPSPGMVQLDPAQKQAPVAAEVFDARQMTLKAKQEVNLLVEKSKAELPVSKHENLQTLSSFTVLAKPGHEAETYDIYRKEVSRSNELLIHENEVIGIRLEETKPGKLYIVCGIYEERNPVVAENAVKENVKPSEVSPVNLSDDEKRKLIVPEKEIAGLAPDQLTNSQWEVMKRVFDDVARAEYSLPFARLFPSQKMDVVRRAISPTAAEGKEIGFVYEGKREVKKAAETLSTMRGDCDDLSLLYISCVKQLKEDKMMDVKDFKIIQMTYYDPEKNDVVSHGNVLHVSMKTKDSKNEKISTFLVDLTFMSEVKDLKLPQEAVRNGNPELKVKLLEHMNIDRLNDKSKISGNFFEWQIYGGDAGVSLYYASNRSSAMVAAGEALCEEAIKLRGAENYGAAMDIHKEADKNFNEAIALLEGAVKLGKERGAYCGDALVDLAYAYRAKADNQLNESSALSNNGEVTAGSAKTAEGKALIAKSNDTYAQAIEQRDVLSSYALNACVSYIVQNRISERYGAGEEMALDSIAKAPFKAELYVTYFKVMKADGKAAEALAKISEYEIGKPGEINSKIDRLIAEVK